MDRRGQERAGTRTKPGAPSVDCDKPGETVITAVDCCFTDSDYSDTLILEEICLVLRVFLWIEIVDNAGWCWTENIQSAESGLQERRNGGIQTLTRVVKTDEPTRSTGRTETTYTRKLTQ